MSRVAWRLGQVHAIERIERPRAALEVPAMGPLRRAPVAPCLPTWVVALVSQARLGCMRPCCAPGRGTPRHPGCGLAVHIRYGLRLGWAAA